MKKMDTDKAIRTGRMQYLQSFRDSGSVPSVQSAAPWATLLLASIAVALFLFPNAAGALEYDRSAIAAGQLWRILLCHWIHYSPSHLFWDLLMFVVLGASCESRSRRSMFSVVAVSAVLIPATVWCLLPGLGSYRGLSGIDCALFMLAAVMLVREESRPGGRRWLAGIAGAMIVLFFVKIAVECITGRAVFADSVSAGFVSVPLAHLVGAAGGLIAPLLRSRARPAERGRMPPSKPTDCHPLVLIPSSRSPFLIL